MVEIIKQAISTKMMNQNKYKQLVITTCAAYKGCSESMLSDNTTFESLGFDTFDMIAFIMQIEDQCEILVEDTELPLLVNLYDVMVLIQNKKAAL